MKTIGDAEYDMMNDMEYEINKGEESYKIDAEFLDPCDMNGEGINFAKEDLDDLKNVDDNKIDIDENLLDKYKKYANENKSYKKFCEDNHIDGDIFDIKILQEYGVYGNSGGKVADSVKEEEMINKLLNMVAFTKGHIIDLSKDVFGNIKSEAWVDKFLNRHQDKFFSHGKGEELFFMCFDDSFTEEEHDKLSDSSYIDYNKVDIDENLLDKYKKYANENKFYKRGNNSLNIEGMKSFICDEMKITDQKTMDQISYGLYELNYNIGNNILNRNESYKKFCEDNYIDRDMFDIKILQEYGIYGNSGRKIVDPEKEEEMVEILLAMGVFKRADIFDFSKDVFDSDKPKSKGWVDKFLNRHQDKFLPRGSGRGIFFECIGNCFMEQENNNLADNYSTGYKSKLRKYVNK